jgi:CHAD domain-containing protein
LLAQCARNPGRKSIHDLRSLTLRLGVRFEHLLLGPAADSASTHAFQHWKKNTRKLRKALQPVRDADVFLARLDSLRGGVDEVSEKKIRLSARCRREIDTLEEHLRQQRKVERKKLMGAINAQSKRLNRTSNEMEAAFATHMPSRMDSAAQAALRKFALLAGELPYLDGDNLHLYRKGLKQALYLAEITAKTDPKARRLAGPFRKMRDAAGEWHDWQALAEEAGRVFPGDDGLVPVLEALAEKALQNALDHCRSSSARLLKTPIDFLYEA